MQNWVFRKAKKEDIEQIWEFRRFVSGEKLIQFLNNSSINYGIQIGVKRAETFYIYKFLWNF